FPKAYNLVRGMENNITAGYITEVFGSFQGEGPHIGERHIFVRFSGCGLGCAYCDTTGGQGMAEDTACIERGPGLGGLFLPNPLDVETVYNAVVSQEPYAGFNSCVSITGGEPLEQPGFLHSLLDAFRGRFRVLLETNGVHAGRFVPVRELVDIVSMDIKLPSASGLGPLWDEHAAFLDAAAGMELIVKAVVSPATAPDEVGRAARLVAEHAPDSVFVIQPMSQNGGVPAGQGEKLLKYYKEARGFLGDVRVIPQAHKILGVR
ncbi:MAG TPA: 7-carboxy-7-deazaguanine synthase QueE, partial [Nitrospirota bacterium]